MRILLLSDSDYLFGYLKGFCFDANDKCEVKAIDGCNNFYNTIIDNPPSFIFIDMIKVSQLLDTTEWLEAQLFIKKNHIALCSFGNQPSDYEEIQSNIVFEKKFPSPSYAEKILCFLKKKLLENKLFSKERRSCDRRENMDRRNFFTQTCLSPPLSVVRNRNHPKGQQNSDGSIRIGSLFINRLKKVIAINDTSIDLTHKEFEIIYYLATHIGEVIETENIIKKVWSKCDRATKADVYQYIHMLRKKIEVDPKNPKLLVTVKGVGYELRP